MKDDYLEAVEKLVAAATAVVQSADASNGRTSHVPNFQLDKLREALGSLERENRLPDPRPHSLGCETYHSHTYPDCCDEDCWCQAIDEMGG